MQENATAILAAELIGESHHMVAVRKSIARVAPTDISVLITGETGVGKDLIARLIHRFSCRAEKPFIPINMAAVPDSIASATLFGHVKGAFTGAVQTSVGLLGAADGGTIYLDELEQASHDLQRLLVSFLDTHSFTPLGSTNRTQVDVRIVAGTRVHPNELNSVLPDLLLRLSGFVLEVPPLRDRPEDIPLLIQDSLKRISSRLGDRRPTFSPEAIARLEQYSFPGNVRELTNIIERAVLLSEGNTIAISDLGLRERQQTADADTVERLRRELSQKTRDMDLLRRGTIPAQPIWEGRWIPIETEYCFVLMPLANLHDLQEIYAKHLRPVVERCGLRCERADDIYGVSGIMQSVWESINRARFVIADLTDRNPNVFYELGIAHTLGKPVIMITQSMDYVPFDLRHLRCILYDFKPGRIEQFQEILEKTIRTVLSSSSSGPSFDLIQE